MVSPLAESAVLCDWHRPTEITAMYNRVMHAQHGHLAWEEEGKSNAAGLGRPFNYMDTFTPLYFFSLFWGHVFFAFQHNLGTFCCGQLLKLII
jgi:hypothetical protein